MLKALAASLAIGCPCVALANETLTMCFRPDAAPFSYIDEQNMPAGYTVELCQRVAESLALKPDMIQVSAEARFKKLNDRVCEMLCEATSVTMERRKIAEFSLMTFLTGSALLFPKDMTQNLKAERRVIVGYLKGTTIQKRREQGLLIGGDLADFTFEPVESHEHALEKLTDGSIHAYIADREILDLMLQDSERLADTHRVSQQSITYEPYAIAVRIGNDTLRNQIDTELAEMFRSKEIWEILSRYVPGRNQDPLLRHLFAIQALPE